MKIVVLLLSILVVGCSTTVSMFPMEGPLSKVAPLPVLSAKVDGILGNTGNISLTYPDGETFTGKWSSMAPQSGGVSAGITTSGAKTGLLSAWAAAFGAGYSVKIVPGVNRGEAVAVGNKGTVVEIEFYTGSGTANGVGVAKDNKGNIYKLLF